MPLVATLIIRPETLNEPPSRGRVEKAATCLRNRGFDIVHLGRFGIMVRALPETYASEFDVDLMRDRAFSSDVKPRTPLLAKLVEAIEVAPPAISLANPVSA
jgi:hypothetical protein